MGDDGTRAKELFLDALELSEDERERFLASACPEDAALRAQVRALLRAHGRAEDVLDGATPALPGSRLELSLGPGDRIGDYELVEELGEGAFGVVFAAEQTEPVRRRVAIKVVKLGMDTRAVIARFEAERQALALMDHPNIARVLDAGATDKGRPYFVMELVDGLPMTEYCDEKGLDAAHRLTLFVIVCRAIQHAHQRGIIHRDIKPSNVLVAEVDGKAIPKVIDFGIAKATERPLTEASVFTRDGHLMGTPAYMSPEQAEGSLAIDTRSDVYSLGALLYELLSGCQPFDPRALGFLELQRHILEVDPPRPSLRTRGARRSGETTLVERIPADLDWIVMRCLEKDPMRRYATAWALGVDVERFLDQRPVEAAPPSALYRLRKLARRHRATTVAIATVVLALVFGITVSSVGFFEVRRTNRDLDQALALAESEAERARQAEARAAEEALEARHQAEVAAAVNEFLTHDLFEAVRPSGAPGRGRDVSMREVLDRAAERLESEIQAGGRFDAAPGIEASLRHAIGGTYAELGEYERGRLHLESSLALRREELGPDHQETLATQASLATVLLRQGDLDGAEALAVDTLERQRRLLGRRHRDTLITQRRLGSVYWQQGRDEESAATYQEALELCLTEFGPLDPLSLTVKMGLAIGYAALGRVPEAEALFVEVWEGRHQVLGPDHPDTLGAAINLATFYDTRGRSDEAEPLFLEALERHRLTLGPEHPETLASQHNMAALWRRQGRYAQAESSLKETLALCEQALGPQHDLTLQTLLTLGLVYLDTGRNAEAEVTLRACYDGSRAGLGPEHPLTLARAKAWGAAAWELGRRAEVISLNRDLLATERLLHGDLHAGTVNSIGNLAMLLRDVGEFEEAQELFEEALALSRELRGDDDHRTLNILTSYAAMLSQQQRHAEAEVLAREAVERARRTLPAEGSDRARHEMQLGVILANQGDFEGGEEHLRFAYGVLLENYGFENPITVAALEKMVVLYRLWKRPDAGEPYEARLRELRGQ